MSHGNRYVPMSFFDSLADARKQLRENSLVSLELQAELAEWMKRPRSVVAYQHFVKVYGGRKLHGVEQEEKGVLLHNTVNLAVGTSPTYYVTADMSEMIKMAAEEMPAEGLTPTIIPSESGFLVFANALPVRGPNNVDEEPDQPVMVQALIWQQGLVQNRAGQMVPGVQYYLFTSAHDAAVMSNQMEVRRLKKTVPEFEIVEPLYVTGDIEETNLATELDVRQTAGPLPLYDFSGWAYGQPWNSVPYDDPAGLAAPGDQEGTVGTMIGEYVNGVQQVHPVVDQARRYLLATWLMLSQTVTTLQTEQPPRFLRRRASRFMPETGDIVIIRLRKEVHEGEGKNIYEPGDEDVPWYNHRFLVRGHWRRQHYGTGTDTKLIWISPFVKGDPSMPLVVKDRIFALEQ